MTLADDINALETVDTVDLWQTGGHVMVLAVNLIDGRLVTFGPEHTIDGETVYELAAISPDRDTWEDPDAWDDGRIAVTYPDAPLTAADVLAFLTR